MIAHHFITHSPSLTSLAVALHPTMLGAPDFVLRELSKDFLSLTRFSKTRVLDDFLVQEVSSTESEVYARLLCSQFQNSRFQRLLQNLNFVHISEYSKTNFLDDSRKKFPAGPGEATENHFTFASGGWGYPPDPH